VTIRSTPNRVGRLSGLKSPYAGIDADDHLHPSGSGAFDHVVFDSEPS